jgi:sugar lactone lactonase YvrE
MAVEASTGNVLVVDSGNDRVQVFAPNGGSADFLAQFGQGELDAPFGIAVDQASGDVYVSSAANDRIVKFESDGAPIPTYTVDPSFASPAKGNAVGKLGSFAAPLAVDPTGGDLLVADPAHNVVARYGSGGAFVSSFDGSDSPDGLFGGLLDLATDAAGKVWVVDSTGDIVTGDASSRVLRFDAAGAYETSLSDVPRPGALTVDPTSGYLIVAANFAAFAGTRLYAYDGTERVTEVLYPGDNSGTVTGLAVDGGPTADRQHLYAASDQVMGSGPVGVQVLEPTPLPDLTIDAPTDVTEISAQLSGIVNPQGVQTSWHFEYSTDGQSWTAIDADQDAGDGTSDIPVTGEAVGLTPDTDYRLRLYATTPNGATRLSAEQTIHTLPADAPAVTIDPVSDITPSGAHLTGTVDPNGLPTIYHFEYSDNGGQSWASLTDDDAGDGDDSVPVAGDITDLRANTPYLARLVATNPAGTTTSGQVTFVTAETSPLAHTLSASPVKATVASLVGEIDTQKSNVDYHFEYGPTSDYGMRVPAVGEASLAAGFPGDFQFVSLAASDLLPGTTYHYRLVASSPGGAVVGADRTFTTLNSDPDLTPGLPDDRAYEQVSPAVKNGNVFGNRAAGVIASTNGNAASFFSIAGFTGTVGSGVNGYTQYASFRGTGGWTMRGVTPTPSPDAVQVFGGSFAYPFSGDLESAVVRGADLLIPTDDSPLYNLYYEAIRTGSLQTILTPGSNPGQGFSEPPQSATDDLGVLLIRSRDNLVPGATGTRLKVYQWDHGVVRLAGLLPGDVLPPEGAAVAAVPGGGGVPNMSAMSRDGSRVIFASPQDEFADGRQLYVRKDATTTVRVTEPEAASPGEARRAIFQAATPDASAIAFTTDERLLDEDTNDGVDLYLWRDSEDPESDSNLTLISTKGQVIPEEAVVSGMSSDAEFVYFASRDEEPGDAADNGTKLYLWHDGEIRFISEVEDVNDREVFSIWPEGKARVSSDGRYLAFLARSPQPVANGQSGHTQMYVYDAQADHLRCVSCTAGDTAPKSDATFLPLATSEGQAIGMPHAPRFMTPDGRRVFFSTADALVPRDVNGIYDAYQYDVESGALSLLSTGRGSDTAFFVDASLTGDDAFIVTAGQLVGWDRDELVDLYDVRVGGGFPEPPAPTIDCDADECQGELPQAPASRRPATTTGAGAGDLRVPRGSFRVAGVSRAQLLRFARTGRLVLPVRITRAGTAAVTATARIAGKRRVVGRARAKARAAGEVLARIRLYPSARRALARHQRLTVSLAVRVTGVPKARTMTLKLKAPQGARARTLNRR